MLAQIYVAIWRPYSLAHKESIKHRSRRVPTVSNPRVNISPLDPTNISVYIVKNEVKWAGRNGDNRAIDITIHNTFI